MIIRFKLSVSFLAVIALIVSFMIPLSVQASSTGTLIYAGGARETNNHYSRVVKLSNENLIVYYSDVRQPNYSQAVVHEVSTNGGVSWGSWTLDVGKNDNYSRPGMPRVTKAPITDPAGVI